MGNRIFRLKAIWDYYLHGINSFSVPVAVTDYTGLSATSVVKIELVDVPESHQYYRRRSLL